MRILAQMILPAQNIAIQNVQVPTFEVGTFAIFGVGCHKYVDMLPFSTQLNPILNNYVNDLRWIFCNEPKVQVSIFEVETFEILRFGGHMYVQMTKMRAQMKLPVRNIVTEVIIPFDQGRMFKYLLMN